MPTQSDEDHATLATALTSFGTFSPEVTRAFTQAFQRRELSAGDRLLRVGEVCTGIGYLVQGLIVSQSTAEPPTSCDIFSEHDFVTNYVSYLARTPSSVELVAHENSRLLWIRREVLDDLYVRVPSLERVGRLAVEARFVSLAARTSGLLEQSPAERYRALCVTRPDLLQRLPQYLLARWLGITPESLSRIRGRAGKPTATQRTRTGIDAVVPSKSKAPSANEGGPKVPRASREKP
jgi:CRP-like cAMP-binding protein